MSNITRELEGLEEGPKMEIHIDLLKTTLKRISKKAPGHDGIHGFWFKKFTSIHGRLPLEMNICFQGTQVPEWMLQRIQRHSRITLHRSTHFKWEQDKTEKSNYGLDWIQKGIWYGPTKLDTTLSKNVQNITWSHKLHRTEHANLESGADSRRKKHSWNKDPKRHFPRRCTITLTILNIHDATVPHTQKMRSRIQTQQITREDQPHGWHWIICKKMKKNWKLSYTPLEYTVRT